MSVRSQDDGARVLGPWFDLLYDAVVEGVRDYYRHYAHWATIHRATTRRSLIRDHIVGRLHAGLAEQRGVQVIPKHGTTLFGFVSAFLMKAHMLNKRMCIALNQTQHSMEFNDNIMEPSLPAEGFAGATSIYVGYLPNPDDPLEPRVFLVCPSGAQPAWHLELKRGDGAEIVDVIHPSGDLDPEQLVEIPSEIEHRQDEDE